MNILSQGRNNSGLNSTNRLSSSLKKKRYTKYLHLSEKFN